MDIQAVAPEIIQDTISTPIPDPLSPVPVPTDEIDATFSTSTIGESSSNHIFQHLLFRSLSTGEALNPYVPSSVSPLSLPR